MTHCPDRNCCPPRTGGADSLVLLCVVQPDFDAEFEDFDDNLFDQAMAGMNRAEPREKRRQELLKEQVALWKELVGQPKY